MEKNIKLFGQPKSKSKTNYNQKQYTLVVQGLSQESQQDIKEMEMEAAQHLQDMAPLKHMSQSHQGAKWGERQPHVNSFVPCTYH